MFAALTPDLLIPLVLGGMVGLILGLLGGGGSVLAIPALTYGLGQDAKTAVATSLLVVGAAALVASAAHGRRGHVNLRVAVVFGLLGAVGGAIASQAARFLPGAAQLVLFSAVMAIAGWRMLRRSGAAQTADADASEPWRLTPRVFAAALGTGLVTGLVGVGGGFLIVPALVFLVGLPIRTAIGTSLTVIAFNAAGGLLGYLSFIQLDLGTTLPFALAATLASLAGTALAQRFSPARLQTGFGAFVLLVAVTMALKEGASLLGH